MTDAPAATPAAPAPAPAAPPAPAPAAPPAAPSPADLAAQLAAAGIEQQGVGIMPPAPAPTDAPNGPAEPDWSDPAAVKAWAANMQKTNADLRRENGNERIQAKQNAAAEERQRIMALLNPEAAAQPVTVEAVQAQLDAQRFDAATAQAAWQLKVDPGKSELLAFKLSRNADAKALDTTAPDFQAKLSAVVQSLVAADPSLGQAAPAAPVASTENLGGADGAGTVTLDAFKAMSMAERGKLHQSDQALYRKLADQL